MAGTEEQTGAVETGVTTTIPENHATKISVDMGAPAAPPAETQATPDFDALIPEKFKTDEHKAWLDSIRNSENPNKLEVMIDQMHNAQKMVGQREGVKIPGAEATPEEVKAFRTALGVPATAEEYKFEHTQWDDSTKEIGELLNASQSPEYMSSVAKMFHEAGIPPKTAQDLINSFNKLQVEQHGDSLRQLAEAQKAVEEDLTTRFNRWYGADVARVSENSQKLVTAAMADPRTPADAKTLIGALGNDFILGLAPIMDYVARTYIKEDTSGARNSLGKSENSSTSDDMASLRAEGGRLMARPEYKRGDPDAVRQVKEHYDRIGALIKAGKK